MTPAKPNDPASVDEYLAGVPEDARAALEKLREAMRAAAPEATEGISYGMPTFWLNGRFLVSYAAWTHHCSIYPLTPAVSAAVGKALERYETEKGTIRFRAEKPPPATFVRKLIKARIAEEKKRAAEKR